MCNAPTLLSLSSKRRGSKERVLTGGVLCETMRGGRRTVRFRAGEGRSKYPPGADRRPRRSSTTSGAKSNTMRSRSTSLAHRTTRRPAVPQARERTSKIVCLSQLDSLLTESALGAERKCLCGRQPLASFGDCLVLGSWPLTSLREEGGTPRQSPTHSPSRPFQRPAHRCSLLNRRSLERERQWGRQQEGITARQAITDALQPRSSISAVSNKDRLCLPKNATMTGLPEPRWESACACVARGAARSRPRGACAGEASALPLAPWKGA